MRESHSSLVGARISYHVAIFARGFDRGLTDFAFRFFVCTAFYQCLSQSPELS